MGYSTQNRLIHLRPVVVGSNSHNRLAGKSVDKWTAKKMLRMILCADMLRKSAAASLLKMMTVEDMIVPYCDFALAAAAAAATPDVVADKMMKNSKSLSWGPLDY